MEFLLGVLGGFFFRGGEGGDEILFCLGGLLSIFRFVNINWGKSIYHDFKYYIFVLEIIYIVTSSFF